MEADTNIENFEFYVPVDPNTPIDKSASIPKDTRRYIQGIASTDDVDLQNETIVQSGIDTSYFMKYGYINDDHKPGPEHKVGEPVECRITKAGLWIKAFLYKGQERAEYWWSFMQSLAQSDANRKVGFSIQGKVLRRAGGSILKCWLQDIAITASPVNTKTWAEIVKSLCKERFCVHPWKTLEKACKGCPGKAACSAHEEEEKALSAGGSLSGGGGRILIPQSLEGGARARKSLPNQVTLNDAIEYLQIEKGLSPASAKAVADAIFTLKA